MKIVLFILILCFSINLISAIPWFNFRSKQVNNSSNTSPVCNKNHTNHSPLQKVLNQQSAGKNNKVAVTPAGRHNFSQTSLSKSIVADSKPNNSSIIKKKLRSFRSRSIPTKQIVKNTKTSLLLDLTTKSTGNNDSQNRQRILASFYYPEQSRAFYQRKNEKNATPTYSNINSL